MTSAAVRLRGRVYGAVLSHIGTEKFFLVVSNNRRNAHLHSMLAVRLTTTKKPSLATMVTLGAEEPFAGTVVCDDIIELYDDEITRDLGALSAAAMQRVNEGLKVALAL